MSRRLVRACALFFCLQIGIESAAAGGEPVVLHDVDVVTDIEFIRGTDATVFIAVSGATALTQSHPLAGAEVVVSLVPGGASKRPAHKLGGARTRADGSAVLRFSVARDIPLGDHVLSVRTRSQHGRGQYRQAVSVRTADMVHVRTDRGVYRPGHTLRWRATAVNQANAHPLADREVEVAIKDRSGTAIWRGEKTTDRTGMIHGQVPLDRDIALGRYTVSARLGDEESSTSVTVKAYHVPAFAVAVELDGHGPFTPGASVRGRVQARYLHGEPVSGQVILDGGGVRIESKTGQLDQHGRMAFTAVIDPDVDHPSIRARVTDGGQRTHYGQLDVPMAAQELLVAVIPERARLIPGVRQWLTVLTTDERGRFATAEISIDGIDGLDGLDGLDGQKRADSSAADQVWASSGAVRIPFTPKGTHGGSLRMRVTARHETLRAQQKLVVRLGGNADRFVRPRQAVVPGGDAVEITGVWKNPRGPLVATLLRRGTPVANAVVKVAPDGAVRAHLQPPPGVFGLATVRITEAFWDRDTGTLSPRYQQATVYLRPTALDVEISGAARYRPGQSAQLDIAVRDRAGRPLAGAGLSASVVDERVLALAEPGPDLLTAVRTLDTGNARAAGLVFASLLVAAPTRNRNLAMRALIEALPESGKTPMVEIAAAARVRAEIVRIQAAREAVYQTLLKDHRPIARRDAKDWEFRDSLDRILVRAGWRKSRRDTPWRNPSDWRYARRLVPEFRFADMAEDLASERLQHLARALTKNKQAFLRSRSLKRLAAAGRIPRYTTVDPWGRAIKIVRGHVGDDLYGDETGDEMGDDKHMFSAISAGPDGTFSTPDDIAHSDILGIHGWYSAFGTGSAGGLGAAHMGVGAAGFAVPSRGSLGAIKEVAVRRRFDQTVLWEAGLITDEHGRYTLEVPLADSITGWRVDVSALGPRGAIGRARTSLQTALPTYLDVSLPNALTVGDYYELPVIVANHSRRQKTLLVSERISGSLQAAADHAAPSARSVTLPAGATAMVAVGVRARAIGQGIIELSLSEPGGKLVDATRHTLSVAAPGHLERAIYTAESNDQGLQLGFTIPADHTPGSARASVSLFRGVVDQAVDGLEGLLREPHGCFEQTSSTTYPNLLVLRLMRTPASADATADKRADATRERARELVGKGYQRLISFEVPGGGFSWFGQAPANQVLTAYGLLEFVDMSAVYPVDTTLIARTRDWLLKQQKNDGSWAPDASWLHDWSAVQGRVSTTAYIAWALAESGYRGAPLVRAFGFLRQHRQALLSDPYLHSLWAAAESAHGRGDNPALSALSEKLAYSGNQAHISAGKATLFYAKGKGADIQVTALATTALARAQKGRDVAKTLAWLWQARDARSGWGTTQGTVLALRAYAHGTGQRAASGRVRVKLGERVVGELDLDSPQRPALELPADLVSGQQRVSIEPMTAQTNLYGVRADIRTRWRTGPVRRASASGVRVTMTDPKRAVRVGQPLPMRVRLANPGTEVIALPTAVIPVPPGFQTVPASLRALEKLPIVDRAEDQGSEIHVYLSRLDAGAQLDLDYQLEATAACDVTQRSARAYAYYDPDTRGASAELRLRASPRKTTE